MMWTIPPGKEPMLSFADSPKDSDDLDAGKDEKPDKVTRIFTVKKDWFNTHTGSIWPLASEYVLRHFFMDGHEDITTSNPYSYMVMLDTVRIQELVSLREDCYSFGFEMKWKDVEVKAEEIARRWAKNVELMLKKEVGSMIEATIGNMKERILKDVGTRYMMASKMHSSSTDPESHD